MFIVTVMIYAVRRRSGAPTNPTVTLAFAAVDHFRWVRYLPKPLFKSQIYHISNQVVFDKSDIGPDNVSLTAGDDVSLHL